tara:strand:- start:1700 stop:2530 length:831 start_codon:yes stop_codon:yes gene_type:complete
MNLEEIHNRVQLLWPKKMSKKIYLSGNKYWDKLREEIPSQLIHGLKKHNDKIGDALSQGQIKSKQWLLSKIKGIDLGMVFICAGWYGTLATMMFEDENIYVDKIRSFDIDDSCWKIAEDLNEPWKADNWVFKATTLDIVSFFTNGYYSDKDTTVINKITNIDNTWSLEEKEKPDTNKTYHYYTINVKGEPKLCQEVPDTIINTSCEHIEKFTEWFNAIPRDKLVVLQSNNYFEIDDHVNCVKDITEFKQQAPLSNIIYEGELELEKYTRFMLIGYK